jgi:hypothetical protein
MRADCHAESDVRIGSCQPSQDRAGTPISCRAMASSPIVTCSPVATTTSYSRLSCSRAICFGRPFDELVGGARHGGDDDGDLVTLLDLLLSPGGRHS